MLGTKKSIAVLVSALLISIGASPLSQANGPIDPTTFAAANTGTDFTIVLGENSGITVESADDVVVNNVHTFSSFDPNLVDKVPDPENYELPSSGVLLQSRSAETENPYAGPEMDTSEYADMLTELLASRSITGQSVRDLSVVEFKFTTDDVNANSVSLDFILASKESVEGDWDLAGIFIDGVNYAFLPNGQLLRVNAAAQITDVCDVGDSDGCEESNYSLNGVLLSAISTKLTLNAALAENTDVHTFVAIMANTNDNSWASSLLVGNFKSFNFTPAEISTFSLGIQIEEEEVIAPPAPPLPDPNQLSTITGTTVSAADSSGNVTITVAGSFPETVRNIDVNGRRLAAENWKQDSTSVSITVPVAATGSYVVQIWNGSFPVLQVQTVIATK